LCSATEDGPQPIYKAQAIISSTDEKIDPASRVYPQVFRDSPGLMSSIKMKYITFYLLTSLMILSSSTQAEPIAADTKPAVQPVILDTDIGSDMDDTWALVMMLRSPELDVKLITSASEDTQYRTKIIAKLLETAKRTDIPIGTGISTLRSDQPDSSYWSRRQKEWCKGRFKSETRGGPIMRHPTG
jgi:hypothetical protein